MGFNSEHTGRIVLDIETVACPDAAEWLDPIKAPSNYKDAAKIAAYAAEKLTEVVNKAALEADLCEIVAIGFMQTDVAATQAAVYTRVDGDERGLLDLLWEAVGLDRSIIGFNSLHFDLPVLIRRSQLLGVPHPTLNLDKYRTPHIDLSERLTFHDTLTRRSLNFYCRRFGLDVPQDTHRGADIAALVAANDWAGVAEHCRCDVLKTAALARRLGYLPSEQTDDLSARDLQTAYQRVSKVANAAR
jgi:hypothetical protein